MNDSLRRSVNALADLAARGPGLQKVVRSVAERRRRRRTIRIAREAGWLGAGLVLGAGLATLWTPITGAEFRKRVSEQATRLRNAVTFKTDEPPTPGRPPSTKSREARTKKSREGGIERHGS